MTLSVASKYVAETLGLKDQGWAESRELKCCLALYGAFSKGKNTFLKKAQRNMKINVFYLIQQNIGLYLNY